MPPLCWFRNLSSGGQNASYRQHKVLNASAKVLKNLRITLKKSNFQQVQIANSTKIARLRATEPLKRAKRKQKEGLMQPPLSLLFLQKACASSQPFASSLPQPWRGRYPHCALRRIALPLHRGAPLLPSAPQ